MGALNRLTFRCLSANLNAIYWCEWCDLLYKFSGFRVGFVYTFCLRHYFCVSKLIVLAQNFFCLKKSE